jgi:hypothetical protein
LSLAPLISLSKTLLCSHFLFLLHKDRQRTDQIAFRFLPLLPLECTTAQQGQTSTLGTQVFMPLSLFERHLGAWVIAFGCLRLRHALDLLLIALLLPRDELPR